ncbi:MAG TPA: phage tail protein [Acetobacteraceae bacterium]|jgi:phage tail-like protein|nr:phage tail protein [Acetobacteraceae bacterium]
MAQQRTNGVPYGAFNFQVTAGPISGSPTSTNAGFQEISGLGMEVTEAEYRVGNDPENYVHKVSGLTKATDVTLKRGVMGWTDLSTWITTVRDGGYAGQTAQAGTTVTINLMDEAQAGPVMTWTLTNAKPKSYKGVTLNAKGGTDVAIEELVLSVEKIDVS